MATELIEAPELEPVDEGPKPNPRTGQTSLTLSLSFVAGIGLTIMIVALGWGVVDGNANGDIVGLLVAGGALTLITGIIGWAGLVRPWENFDNINEAHYHGHAHHDDAHHDEEHDDSTPVTDAH